MAFRAPKVFGSFEKSIENSNCWKCWFNRILLLAYLWQFAFPVKYISANTTLPTLLRIVTCVIHIIISIQHLDEDSSCGNFAGVPKSLEIHADRNIWTYFSLGLKIVGIKGSDV